MVLTSTFKKVLAFGMLMVASAAARGPTRVGVHEPLAIDVTAGASRQHEISHPGASYIAVHFSEFNLGEGDVVIVRAPDSSVSYEYTGRGRADLGSFHATFVPGNTAIIEYRAAGTEATNGFGFKIDGFARGIARNFQETICSKDDSQPAKCFLSGADAASRPMAYTRAKAVARLLIEGESMCTGWLVGSEGHLITNQHCISKRDQALRVDIDFTAESKSCQDKCEVQLGCAGKVVATKTKFISNNAEHDWALLKIEDVDLSAFGYLQLRPHGPFVGEEIYIPQHPAGWAKRIASVVDGGAAATVTSTNATSDCGVEQVGYMADTQGGSSGSPVISVADNTVVALHHCGGCENTAVNVDKLHADFAKEGIVIKDMVAGGASSPTSQPRPTQQPPAPMPAPASSPAFTPSAQLPTTKPKPVPTGSKAPVSFCGDLKTKKKCSLWSATCAWDAEMKQCISL